jgi:hypothetical protein
MRQNMDDKWPNYLNIVVDGLNEIPRKKLGFIAPAEINSLADGDKVFKARKDLGIKVYQEPDYHTQNDNQDAFEDSLSKFQVGTFVYLDNKATNFTKSFDTQVCFFFNRNICKICLFWKIFSCKGNIWIGNKLLHTVCFVHFKACRERKFFFIAFRMHLVRPENVQYKKRQHIKFVLTTNKNMEAKNILFCLENIL